MDASGSEDWPRRYAEVAADVVDRAPYAAPLLAGFNACVDALHHVDADGLARLAAARATDPRARQLVDTVLDRIVAGRGGEVFIDWSGGSPWVLEVLGEPARHQIGGTGPQAAWAWAELGAPAVVPVADRSRLQLDVLHPDTALCEPHGLRPAGAAVASSAQLAKPRHHILEFSAGTAVPATAAGSGGPGESCESGRTSPTRSTLPRSSRIILRFADDGIERDEQFANATSTLCTTAYAGLVSGLNGFSDTERADRGWLRQLTNRLRDAGLPLIHLELAEFSSVAALRRVPAEYAGAVDSLGMSLSELRTLLGTALPADPAEVVRELAVEHRLRRVSVHADEWALSVYRAETGTGGSAPRGLGNDTEADPRAERTALLTGNLLAAARAHDGCPVPTPATPDDASYAADRPATKVLGQGWYAECVPAPYLPHPVSTIGLGDTFVAGLLLAPSLRATATPAPPTTATAGRGHDHQ